MYGNKECKENEVFVGNTWTNNVLDYLDNKVKYRKGAQAYTYEGRKIDPNYMRPLFVEKSDFKKYEKIMNARCRE